MAGRRKKLTAQDKKHRQIKRERRKAGRVESQDDLAQRECDRAAARAFLELDRGRSGGVWGLEHFTKAFVEAYELATVGSELVDFELDEGLRARLQQVAGGLALVSGRRFGEVVMEQVVCEGDGVDLYGQIGVSMPLPEDGAFPTWSLSFTVRRSREEWVGVYPAAPVAIEWLKALDFDHVKQVGLVGDGRPSVCLGGLGGPGLHFGLRDLKELLGGSAVSGLMTMKPLG